MADVPHCTGDTCHARFSGKGINGREGRGREGQGGEGKGRESERRGGQHCARVLYASIK